MLIIQSFEQCTVKCKMNLFFYRPGVCLVVSGPGLIHALGGMANAMSNCWLVCRILIISIVQIMQFIRYLVQTCQETDEFATNVYHAFQ